MNEQVERSVVGPLQPEEMEQIYADLMSRNFYDENYNASLWVNEPYRLMANILNATFDLKVGQHVVDIGSGAGFLVSELIRQGVLAHGYEFSKAMLNQIEQERRSSFTAVNRIEEIPLNDARLITSLEVFEHLPFSFIDHNLKYLYRECRCPIMLTIPSSGMDKTIVSAGFYETEKLRISEMRSHRLFRYLWLENGLPGAGHISLASWNWWEDLFIAYGFSRDFELEKKLNNYSDILKAYRWCPYILNKIEMNSAALGRGWEKQSNGDYVSTFNPQIDIRASRGFTIEMSLDVFDINRIHEPSAVIEVEQIGINSDLSINTQLVVLDKVRIGDGPTRISVEESQGSCCGYRIRLHTQVALDEVGDYKGLRLRNLEFSSTP